MTTGDNSSSIRGITSRTRVSPFYGSTQSYGCKAYTIYNHMLMPTYYGDPEAEYWKQSKEVTLWDVGCQRQVEITGIDAPRFVQLLTPCNLQDLKVGQCRRIALTTMDGGIINDPTLMRVGENRYWLSISDSDVLLWAKGVAYGQDIELSIVEPDASPLQLEGPQAKNVLKELLGDWVDEIKPGFCREEDVERIPICLSRTGWSKENGYKLFLKNSRYGERIWEMIMKVGSAYEIGVAAPSAIARIERGIFSYGSDITIKDNPFELGMDKDVDLEADYNFIGKQALSYIKKEGIEKRMVGIDIQGEPLKESNVGVWKATSYGTEVGFMTSGVYSPKFKKNIGFAMLKSDYAKIGQKIKIETHEGRIEAVVVQDNVYDNPDGIFH